MLGSGLSHSQQCCPKPEHDDDDEGDGDGDGDHEGDGDPPVLPATWLLLGRKVSRP